MAERRSRRLVIIIASVAVVAVVLLLLLVASFLAAERRLRSFCAEVRDDSQWSALAMAAGARGLRVVEPLDERPARVTDPSAFGRQVCEIGVGPDGRVTASRHLAND